MKLRTAFCAAGLLLTSNINPVFSADSGFIKPGTPEAAQAISALNHAQQNDRMNARSYSGGENSEAGVFYYKKSKETQALLEQLNHNQPITSSDLKHALDGSNAWRYTGGY
jgi:hypothetical protein